MNQIFTFKPQFKQLILDSIKTYTTRIETPFRLKCDTRDIMYCATGIRTKEYNRFADARVIGRWRWGTQFEKICPVDILWDQFAIAEGFDNLQQLKDWFCKKLITYKFEVIRIFGE